MNTTFTVSLPEDIASCLTLGQDLSRLALEALALEALALEGYRAEKLSIAHVRRMLGFQNRCEVDAFLGQHGIELEYSQADLERDRETHRLLGL